jgi:hypothetical protein
MGGQVDGVFFVSFQTLLHLFRTPPLPRQTSWPSGCGVPSRDPLASSAQGQPSKRQASVRAHSAQAAANCSFERPAAAASRARLLFNAHRAGSISTCASRRKPTAAKNHTKSASFPYAIIMMHLARPRCGPPSRSPGRLLRSGPRAAPLTPLAGSHPSHQRCGMVSHGAFMRSAHLGTYGTSRPFWGSSFNDGTTQTALDPPGRGPVRTLTLHVRTEIELFVA